LRIFFATDIHGSDICWKKFINAAKFYEARVIILGGDMTGKAIIPVIRGVQGYEVSFMDRKIALSSEDEVRALEKSISDKGYYPVRLAPDEIAHLSERPEERDALFTREALKRVEEWLDFAENRLRGANVQVYACPGNDDFFEIDEALAQSELVHLAEGQAFDLDLGFRLLSTGWSNPTPWNTFREEPEEQLARRLDKLAGLMDDPTRTLCSLHAPPYGSGLDDAPELDENLRPKYAGQSLVPVGSKAVREFIDRHQPALGLFGHIHEARGAQRLGRTLAINPGSAYEQGSLQGALIELGRKGVQQYLLTSG
jgi:hypothetical protein